MDTNRYSQVRRDDVTSFGGLREDFVDLYWEDEMSARQHSSASRGGATLTSQIENIIRRNL